MWTAPTATEMRFGFEVTMYVNNKQSVTSSKETPVLIYRGFLLN